MKKILTSLALLGLVVAGTWMSSAAAIAEEEQNPAAPTHFPINEPKEMSWSFAGPFGTYDKAQLQRGLKVYKEVCSACHSMNLVAFRTLEGLGYSEAQIKTLAAEYPIHDGPNDAGDMFDRPGKPSDPFHAPFPNEQAARASTNGALPPDFSLIAKSRAGAGFTGYDGADYIYSLMTSYKDPAPEGFKLGENMH